MPGNTYDIHLRCVVPPQASMRPWLNAREYRIPGYQNFRLFVASMRPWLNAREYMLGGVVTSGILLLQ